jgi:hypothetical protein
MFLFSMVKVTGLQKSLMCEMFGVKGENSVSVLNVWVLKHDFNVKSILLILKTVCSICKLIFTKLLHRTFSGMGDPIIFVIHSSLKW